MPLSVSHCSSEQNSTRIFYAYYPLRKILLDAGAVELTGIDISTDTAQFSIENGCTLYIANSMTKARNRIGQTGLQIELTGEQGPMVQYRRGDKLF